METVLTVKLHIYPNAEQQKLLSDTMEVFRQVCNTVSIFVFDNEIYSRSKIQKQIYKQLRNEYDFKSQMTISAIRTVAARYSAIKTQLRDNPFVYEDNSNDTVYRIPKDLSWLWKAVSFERPCLVLQRERDWSFKNNDTVSLNTTAGRVTVPYKHNGYFDKYLTNEYKLGAGQVVRKHGKWFFHVSVTPVANTANTDKCFDTVVGIDRGIRNIVSISDTNGERYNISGEEIQSKRDRYQKVRSSLQSKGTRGAKRVLKRISGRENGWMADVNHRLSKALALKYKNSLFVLEDLSGVSFDVSLYNKEHNRHIRQWSFYDLECKLAYKAKMSGSAVIKVPSSYTSQRCPVCGHIDKEARDRTAHLYTCTKCGYQGDDDLTASDNILQLGIRYLNGEEKPRFTKPK